MSTLICGPGGLGAGAGVCCRLSQRQKPLIVTSGCCHTLDLETLSPAFHTKTTKQAQVKAYLFNGYWEDIGTIKSFFEENLKLAQQ
jgi:hypothetical protein